MTDTKTSAGGIGENSSPPPAEEPSKSSTDHSVEFVIRLQLDPGVSQHEFRSRALDLFEAEVSHIRGDRLMGWLNAAYRMSFEPEPADYCACGCGDLTSVATKSQPLSGHEKGQPKRYLQGHWARDTGEDYLEADRGYDTACWIWQKTVDNGYGIKWNRKAKGGIPAHRIYYEKAFGPLPKGTIIHHRCEVKLCVNPDHLEALTNREHGLLHEKQDGRLTKARSIRWERYRAMKDAEA